MTPASPTRGTLLTRRLAPALLLACLPAGAGAQLIRNSAHDLSASSARPVRATTEAEICKFCHTPHGAAATQLLWNHAQSAQTTFNWGGQLTTFAGTTLPTTLRPASKTCLGCHDGTVAIGDVRNAGSGSAGIIAVADVATAGHNVTGGRMSAGNVNLVGATGSLAGSHPVSIPYAGQTGYNGINSAVPPGQVNNTTGSYWTISTSGCVNGTGVCTSASGGGTNGAVIQLYENVPGTRSNVGIECDTCHEPHNRYGFAWLMRVDALNSDGLCRSCHNK